MLCPEVWSFSRSQKNTCQEIGNYDNKAKQNIDKVIKSCIFNKMVSIVLPDHEYIPAAVNQLIDAGDYYLIRELKLSDLVRKDFIEAFIKRGRLTGISSDVEIGDGGENVFAITPDGNLILLICKDLYQIIGLQGRPIGLNRNKERFEITIDLKNHEQSKFYNRIKSAFSTTEIDRFDFQLSWESIDVTICPSSIAKFFNDSGYKVEQHSIQVQSTTIKNLKMPNQIFLQRQVDAELANAAAEYFASVMLECGTDANQQISTYRPDIELNLHSEQSTHALILHCKGLLIPEFIGKLMEVARLPVDCKPFVISVNAYEKDPIGTANINGYTIILLNGTKYFLFKDMKCK